jgi:PAS domain S-box-containing protein
MLALTAWADANLPTLSLGFLYLFPILISAAALNGIQIIALSALCSFLQEAFGPLHWSEGTTDRILVVAAGFAMTGFFVTGLSQRRRLLQKHLTELEAEVKRRQDAESQVRILIETSPLAILTIDTGGQVVLANESAHGLFGVEPGSLPGMNVATYLPILPRMLHSHYSSGNMRTNVECKVKRSSGEIFLAHVWLSTYAVSDGLGLAAVIWDASENLRDREGAGLDSMMATSRVLIGALSHEIRNLAAAAASSYAKLTPSNGLQHERYDALGSLIRALESIATSGLRMASQREPAVADLGTVLDEARIVIEPGLREAGFAVMWKIDEGLPLVQADQQSLMQVFVNLARNILVHGADWPQREVLVEASFENDLVAVRFRDWGPGVPHPDELFKPFQPGASSAGLGLYISRAILRSHGGNLRYDREATGSCFTVELWPVEKMVET